MTIYSTPRGDTYDPMPVELWRFDGRGAVGRLETAEEIEFTWADRTSGTAVIDTPLTDLSRMLLDKNGETLVVATFNGKRHVSTVVESEVFSKGDRDVRVRAVCASAWSLLEGQRIPPVPDQPLSLQQSAEFFTLTGPVETVVKTLVGIGARRVGHPIQVREDLRRGPIVTVKARNDTTAELVAEALAGTGYRLSLEAWLPGDDPIGQLPLTMPSIVADVVPYRDQPGLVWSSISDDLDDWGLTHKRPAMTRVVVGDGGEKTEQRFISVMSSAEPVSPWARREGYVEAGGGEASADRGASELAKHAGSVDLEATAAPSQSWEFGADGKYPRQFDVGDWVSVDLGAVGVVRQVITEVTVKLTPVSLTVTPKVSTPDTTERDLYAMVTDLDKRLERSLRR